jgi:hypothetical protein
VRDPIAYIVNVPSLTSIAIHYATTLKAAALEALAPYIPSGRVVINDLHGDLIARCGPTYTATGACELQLPNNVHYECEGRQYCALSVVAKILEVLYGFGRST